MSAPFGLDVADAGGAGRFESVAGLALGGAPGSVVDPPDAWGWATVAVRTCADPACGAEGGGWFEEETAVAVEGLGRLEEAAEGGVLRGRR